MGRCKNTYLHPNHIFLYIFRRSILKSLFFSKLLRQEINMVLEIGGKVYLDVKKIFFQQILTFFQTQDESSYKLVANDTDWNERLKMFYQHFYPYLSLKRHQYTQ
jgi:hypothetical protein